MKNSKIIIRVDCKDKVPKQPLSLLIRNFLSDFDKYDFEPPYQRGDVWSKGKRRRLIESIIHGRKINPISVVQKGEGLDNIGKYWMLDGKQRGRTIWMFAKGGKDRFTIHLEIGGKIEEVTYQNIVDRQHKSAECASFLEKFHNYQLDIQVYENMTSEEQRQLFEVINFSEPLRANEKLFLCKFVLCRILYRYLWNSVIYSGDLKNAFTDGLQKNRGETGTKYAHDIVYLTFGWDLEGEYIPRSLATNCIEDKSLKKMEERLHDTLHWDANTSISDDLIKKEFPDMYDSLKKAVKCLSIVLDKEAGKKGKHGGGKAFHRNTFLDTLVFFIRKIREGVLTESYVGKLQEKFHLFMRLYEALKSSSKADRKVTVSVHEEYVKKRQEIVEGIFNGPYKVFQEVREGVKRGENVQTIEQFDEDFKDTDFNFSFDTGKKKQPFSETLVKQKIQATNKIGTLDIHHDYPKSISSNSKPVVLTKSEHVAKHVGS
jgi:hypothetical protein